MRGLFYPRFASVLFCLMIAVTCVGCLGSKKRASKKEPANLADQDALFEQAMRQTQVSDAAMDAALEDIQRQMGSQNRQ